MTIYQILSEDHVVEALTRYLREPPFKLDFDVLEISVVEFDENEVDPVYRFEVTLHRGSDEN
jgi:hypothetical protein